MIKAETPFPHVGSFALFIDDTLPVERQRAELVRVMRFDQLVAIAFPLRTGASGNRVVAAEDLIDGTPLTKEEERELTDLQRTVARQVRPNRAKVDRCEALRKRLIYSRLLTAEKDKLARLDARQQPSRGAALPPEERFTGEAA